MDLVSSQNRLVMARLLVVWGNSREGFGGFHEPRDAVGSRKRDHGIPSFETMMLTAGGYLTLVRSWWPAKNGIGELGNWGIGELGSPVPFPDKDKSAA